MNKLPIRKRDLLLSGLSLAVILAIFISGWVSGLGVQVLAQIANSDNPVAQIARRILPNPNLLAEDHVELSCEPNFSVKVFTMTPLFNATFEVRDSVSGALLYSTVVLQINPLWQKVWLGPLSSIPPKIDVIMTAYTKDGSLVTHTLTLEPDCDELLVDQTTIIFPPPNGCKLIINPGGGGGGGGGGDGGGRRNTGWPTVAVAVSPSALGHSMSVTVRDIEGMSLAQGGVETIPTEILSLNLTSVNPIPLAPSFFDVFFDISIDGIEQTKAACKVFNGEVLENLLMQIPTPSPLLNH